VGSGRIPGPATGAEVYAALQALHFVEAYRARGHNVHSLTRRVLLARLWADEPDFFRSVSEAAAAHFEAVREDFIDRRLVSVEAPEPLRLRRPVREVEGAQRRQPEYDGAAGRRHEARGADGARLRGPLRHPRGIALVFGAESLQRRLAALAVADVPIDQPAGRTLHANHFRKTPSLV
jgi:hypothetical protein